MFCSGVTVSCFFCFFFHSNFCIATDRLYAADITTTDYSGCVTTGGVDWYFGSNCTYIDSGGIQQQYCNTDVSLTTSTQTFTPANPGETTSVSYQGTNIGDAEYIYMAISHTDAWCLDTITFLMNDVTNEWRQCEFSSLMGRMVLDTDCSANGGFESVAFDVASSDSVCYDADPPTLYPTSMCFFCRCDRIALFLVFLVFLFDFVFFFFLLTFPFCFRHC